MEITFLFDCDECPPPGCVWGTLVIDAPEVLKVRVYFRTTVFVLLGAIALFRGTRKLRLKTRPSLFIGDGVIELVSPSDLAIRFPMGATEAKGVVDVLTEAVSLLSEENAVIPEYTRVSLLREVFPFPEVTPSEGEKWTPRLDAPGDVGSGDLLAGTFYFPFPGKIDLVYTYTSPRCEALLRYLVGETASTAFFMGTEGPRTPTDLTAPSLSYVCLVEKVLTFQARERLEVTFPGLTSEIGSRILDVFRGAALRKVISDRLRLDG